LQPKPQAEIQKLFIFLHFFWEWTTWAVSSRESQG
jgi:hypothetical protein